MHQRPYAGAARAADANVTTSASARRRASTWFARLLRALPCAALLAACAWVPVWAETPDSAPSLLPLPAEVQFQDGYYQPATKPRVGVPAGAGMRALGAVAGDLFETTWGRHATVADKAGAKPADLTLALAPGTRAKPDAYALKIDATGIHLQAPSESGLFYGLQTLRQLLEQSDATQGLRFVHIVDAPRFSWRGLHLDVGRHLFPVDYIKRQLDLMARYKFNVLHWHLTEDQGWRLQIKRYPKLTQIGAWRKRTELRQRDGTTRYDDTRYGGFYTQDQAREIVAYASKLNITVVPEIEMPGHAVAALAAYPELGCTPGPFEVWTNWGVNDEVFCPSEQTFRFIEGVLDEVMAVFPSKYIHVGGDEAPIVRWQHSALAQDIIRREGLQDEHALQGWFMRRVEKYLQQHDRRMLAWDEMLAGKPAQSTTIMAWRSLDEGVKAAQAGHDVVMTPTSYSYFDYCQSRSLDDPYCPGYLPLQQVYAFEPVPPQLDATQASHVLGGQANLWTEHIRTPEHAQYMLWPRALAMSEVLWSPASTRDWTGFSQRLAPQLAALGKLGVNYRVPEVLGLDGDVLSLSPQVTVKLRSPLQGAAIVYTLDGSQPHADSPRYGEPLVLTLGAQPTTVTARLLAADGRLGPGMRAHYALTTLQPARDKPVVALQPGLQRDYFEGAIGDTDTLLDVPPLRSVVTDTIGLPGDARPEGFGLRYRGLIDIPVDGAYRFSLSSDDGARLLIDDALLIDRDGPQSPGVTHGSVGLAKGLHGFELRYFQGGGDKVLRLQVSRDGAAGGDLSGTWLWHVAANAHRR